MQIFLNLDGQQQGPYTPEQLQAWLQSGQVAPETPAWHDGLTDWIAAGELVAEPVETSEDGAGEVFLHIEHQPEYSRGELLLRKIFGLIYIDLPHGLCLPLLGLACALCSVLAWFVVLFTGNHPDGLYQFMNRALQWLARWGATAMNLVDGFPALGLGNRGDRVDFSVERPAEFSRGKCLLRLFAVVYVVVPHGLCLWFRVLTSVVLVGIMFWVTLFTGKYPRAIHEFNMGTLRWALRVAAYLALLTDRYPAFSGKP
jgi:hypothetical protein